LEFRKARGNLTKTREHHDLLNRLASFSSVIRHVAFFSLFFFRASLCSVSHMFSSVRRDIRSYKSGIATTGSNGAAAAGTMR
jgi:hypothetical protein